MKRMNLKLQIFLCAAAGILFGTIFCNQVFCSGLVSYSVLYQCLERGWNRAAAAKRYFAWRVVCVRLSETILVFMLARSRLRKVLVFLYCLLMGVCLSAILTILTWNQGILGLPYFLACMFPHMFFYIMLWGLLTLRWRISYEIRSNRFWSAVMFCAAIGICSEIFLNSRILGLLIGVCEAL